MVHVSPEPPRWRRGNVVAGVLLTLLGVAVLVVSIVALQQPGGHAAAAGTPTVTRTTTYSVRPTPSSSVASSSAAPSSGSPSTAAASSTPAASGTSASGTVSGPKSIPLVVLNNTTTGGLAERASATFTAGGWTVTSYGNYTNNILSTCAYYDPSVPGAQAAATALQSQFPAIKRVKEKFNGLPAGPIVVVLTPDYG